MQSTPKSVMEVEGGEVGQFKMLVNEKSFSVIISGIYADKIRAIVREYCTNCVDSHKEAGHSKPFDVHLPSNENPTFWVRDYGVGLDEDDIVNVFTVAFASTKDKSRLTTGELGIGSMSGFCFNTKGFTVTSWKGGKKYIYHCYLESGVPNYNKLLEKDSDEPSGVKVEMPVGYHDFKSFQNRAKSVLKWFDIKPNFVGETQITLEEPNKIVEGEDWFITDYVDECSVLMGGVLYKVEDGADGLTKYSNFIDESLVITAPMGSVEFAPSREGLQYTPKTVSFLRKKFDKIGQELATSIEEKIKGCKSLWDAKIAFDDIKKQSMAARLIDLASVKWAGHKLNTDLTYSPWRDTDFVNEGYTCRGFQRSRYRQNPHEDYSPVVVPNADTHICLNDMKTGYIGRAKNYVQNHANGRIIVISPPKDGSLDDLKTFLKGKLGCLDDHFTLASELPDPPKRARQARNRVGKVSRWKYDHRLTYSWQAEEIDGQKFKTDTFYYVERNGYYYIKNGDKRDPDSLLNYYEFANAYLGKETPIFGVATKEVPNLPSNWIEFTSFVEKKLEEVRKDCQNYRDQKAIKDTIETYITQNKEYYNLIRRIEGGLPNNHQLIEWANNLDVLRKQTKGKEPKYYEYARHILKLDLTVTPKIDFRDHLVEKYELLPLHNNRRPGRFYYGEDYRLFKNQLNNAVRDQHFLNYILGVDQNG